MGGQWVAHYIDNFITLGAPDSTEREDNAPTMHEACTRVGLQVEPEKDEHPATTISYVGTDSELDSVAMEIRLPIEKLKHLKEELSVWRGRKACKKRVTLINWPPLLCL